MSDGCEPVIHLRNGCAKRRPHVRGEGVTWCGKKLLGAPESEEDGVEMFLCYGNDLAVTFDTTRVSCPHCNAAFEAAYQASFPEGLKPIATFKLDDLADVERARRSIGAEALAKAFGPGGRGMDEVLDNLGVAQ